MTSIKAAPAPTPTPAEQANAAISAAVSDAGKTGEVIRAPLGVVSKQISLTADQLVNGDTKAYLVGRAKVTGDVAVPASRCAAAGSNLSVIKALELDASDAVFAGAKAAIGTIAQEPAKTEASAKANNNAAGSIAPNVDCPAPAPAPAPAPPKSGKDKPN